MIKEMEALECSQECYLHFLKEYLNLIKNLNFKEAVEYLKRTKRIFSENQVYEHDKEILNKIKMLENVFINATIKANIWLIEKEIDILCRDISISQKS